MRVLITGGAGYIGTELTYKLDQLKSVSEIIIYDNLSRSNYNLFIGVTKLSKKVKFVNADILDSRKLKKEIEKVNIVFHLAAKVTVPFIDTNIHEFEQINNWGTSEVVYAVENSNVDKLVYLSSVSVYGANDQHVKDTSSLLDPHTYYGISKKRAEEHIDRISKKKNTYVFRCGNAYGYSKSMRFDTVINRFMFEANNYNKITIKGSGKQIRTFIHIDTIINELLNVINDKLAPNTYNLTESNWSILELVDSVKELYPNIEMMFTNQHFPIKSITVEADNNIPDLKERNLTEDLISFKSNFTF